MTTTGKIYLLKAIRMIAISAAIDLPLTRFVAAIMVLIIIIMIMMITIVVELTTMILKVVIMILVLLVSVTVI